MLECRHLAVAYGRHQALKGVDLRVAPGEIVVILGANGAGKTTLLKAIAGLVPALPGTQVLLDGKVITQMPPHRIVEAGLALVPEGRGIFADLTVKENLLLGAFAQRAREREQEHLQRVLSLFPKLAERSAQQARTMSGGEQQMVAIGRALMSSPAILMLDEPSLGLSPLLCFQLFKALAEVRKTGVGILLVEQNARQSLAIADRAYLLENGHIVGEGPAAQLARDPAVQAAYLGGAAAAAAPAAAAPAAPAVHVAGAGMAASRSAPSALPEGVRAAMAAAQSALAARSIPAATQATRSTPADALIPSRIADLVRNAAAVQARHIEEQRAGRALAHETAPAVRPVPGTGHAWPAAAVGALPATSLAEALARIEAAAAQALRREPARAASAVLAAPAAREDAARAPAPQRTAPLPTIEVWRKPGVEIWRRSDDGTLQRGE